MASDAFLNSIEINFKKAAQYIQKIRNLAKQVAKSWAEKQHEEDK